MRRHGLDFAGCEAVFDHPVITREDDRDVYSEQWINLLGWLDGRIVHMTYTKRGDALHVISLCQATTREAHHYQKVFSRDL